MKISLYDVVLSKISFSLDHSFVYLKKILISLANCIYNYLVFSVFSAESTFVCNCVCIIYFTSYCASMLFIFNIDSKYCYMISVSVTIIVLLT